MIFAENLTKHFDDFVAVDGINLDVKAGEVLVLLGPNGAGKTTTVRMLTSILRPTRGKASIAGYDVVEHPDKVRSMVGVLTENHGLYNRMNVVEYLMFFASLYNLEPKAARERMDELLLKFGLSFALKKRLGEYSKGMRQKLALVRALLHDPTVLLLDEPTSAMDPESARTVRDAIHQLKSGNRTLILCTHNLVEAEELADKIAIIRLGKIIFNDSPRNLKLQLLGPMEYEVHLANSLNGWLPEFPDGVKLLRNSEKTLRFSVSQPEVTNPILVRQLMDHHLDIVAFQQVQRSLEDAYLQAVSQTGKFSHDQ